MNITCTCCRFEVDRAMIDGLSMYQIQTNQVAIVSHHNLIDQLIRFVSSQFILVALYTAWVVYKCSRNVAGLMLFSNLLQSPLAVATMNCRSQSTQKRLGVFPLGISSFLKPLREQTNYFLKLKSVQFPFPKPFEFALMNSWFWSTVGSIMQSRAKRLDHKALINRKTNW